MKPERFKRTKSVVASGAIALVVAALVIGLSSFVIGSRPASSGPERLPGAVLASSTTCGPSDPTFCVTPPTTGPTLYPLQAGATAQNMPLALSSPLNVPLNVYKLVVTITSPTTFPAHCPASNFQFNNVPFTTGSPPMVTLDYSNPSQSSHWVPISMASGGHNGTGTYPGTLALVDSGLDQTSCHSLSPLTLSFSAWAYYTDTTHTVLTSSSNPSLFGQSVTYTATVSANNAGADTSKPAGTVTFYECTTSACTAFKSPPLASGVAINVTTGQASFSTSALSIGTHYLDAVYAPTDSTNFASSNGLLSQTVGLPSSCDNSTHNGGYTVKSGQSICLTGRVNGRLTVSSGGAVYLSGATINGGITATGATAIRICGTNVSGNVSVSGSTGFVMIGDGGDDGTPACAGNTISTNLTATNNTGGIESGGNTVGGSVTISGNTVSGSVGEGVAEVEANKITGGLSCASSNNPALTNDGLKNTVSGSRSGQCTGSF